jgi:hypothetical protein
MLTCEKRLEKLGCDSEKLGHAYQALAISQILPYYTERDCQLIQKVASLLRSHEVFVNRLEGLAVPLHFLSEHRRRSLVEIVRGAPHMDRYAELVGVIKPLELLLKAVANTCGVVLTPEFYKSRGGVKARIEWSKQDNSSNGGIDCRRLDEVKKEVENWVWNPGGVTTLYHPAQLITVPYEPIVKYIYAREELPKCEGSLEDLGLCKLLDPDYLVKATLAYREYCMEGGRCETLEKVCVDEKWCRNRNAEYDAIAGEGMYNYILHQSRRIFREWSTKFGVIGGIRVVFDDPYKGRFPLKTVRYILEPPPIIKILARSPI